MQETQAPSVEAAILTRVVQPHRDDLSLAGARALLKLDFTDNDRDRMHLLVTKNQGGGLTPEERQELDSYVRVGRFIDLIGAKARLSLKRRGRQT